MSKELTLELLRELRQHHTDTIASEGGGYYGDDQIVAYAKEDLREIEKAIKWVEEQ